MTTIFVVCGKVNYTNLSGYSKLSERTYRRHVAADGFYSKYKWVNGVVSLGYHSIGKLRPDANLKFLYDCPYSGRERPQRYDAKVNLKDTTRFEFIKSLEDGVKLYTDVVWSVCFKREVRLAYLQKEQNARLSYVVLFFHRHRH